jgi:hypothetical protein
VGGQWQRRHAGQRRVLAPPPRPFLLQHLHRVS